MKRRTSRLVQRTGRSRARGATRLARVNMAAVATAGRIAEVRNCQPVRRVIYIDTVAQPVIGKDVKRGIEYPGDRAQRNVRHVVEEAPAIRIARRIAAQHAAALRTFVESTPAGQKQLPSRLEDLLRDPRFPTVKRHLRRIYADPMTGQQDWALVPAKGGGFIGIHSLSDAAPIRKTGFDIEFLALTNKKKYSEWVFGMPASEAVNVQTTPPSAPQSDPSIGPAVTPPRPLTTLP